tara:strand:+ start:53 stop:604 length:552 start_codon:yes stop_codon:yes gene_type:complete
MKSLTCDSKKGREYESHEEKAILYIQEKRDVVITSTRSEGNEESKILEQDILISKKDERGIYRLRAVGEFKNRDEFKRDSGIPLTLERLKGDRPNDGYMISLRKLKSGQLMSESLKVPFVVIVNLLNDKYILCWKVTNNKGEWLKKPESLKQETQKNIKGGNKLDNVVYLKLKETAFQLEKNY